MNQHNPASASVYDSFAYVVDKFLFDKSYKATNQKLVQFTFSHAIKADKKQKQKISNPQITDKKCQFDLGYWYMLT